MNRGLSWFVLILMLVGYLFLYGPILSLIVYSFNVSKLVTVWGGFSFKWYGVLAQDYAIIRAVKLSFLIAAVSATKSAIPSESQSGGLLARSSSWAASCRYGARPSWWRINGMKTAERPAA